MSERSSRANNGSSLPYHEIVFGSPVIILLKLISLNFLSRFWRGKLVNSIDSQGSRPAPFSPCGSNWLTRAIVWSERWEFRPRCRLCRYRRFQSLSASPRIRQGRCPATFPRFATTSHQPESNRSSQQLEKKVGFGCRQRSAGTIAPPSRGSSRLRPPPSKRAEAS